MFKRYHLPANQHSRFGTEVGPMGVFRKGGYSCLRNWYLLYFFISKCSQEYHFVKKWFIANYRMNFKYYKNSWLFCKVHNYVLNGTTKLFVCLFAAFFSIEVKTSCVRRFHSKSHSISSITNIDESKVDFWPSNIRYWYY